MRRPGQQYSYIVYFRFPAALLTAIGLILLPACDSGGGSSTSEQLTVTYVNSELTAESVTTNGTTLVHDDGLQAGAYDLNLVILSRVNSTFTGEPLAYAYRFNTGTAYNTVDVHVFLDGVIQY